MLNVKNVLKRLYMSIFRNQYVKRQSKLDKTPFAKYVGFEHVDIAYVDIIHMDGMDPFMI